MLRVELVGQRFDRLTVVEYAGSRGNGSAIWRCLCDCGKLVERRADKLQETRGHSCGCGKNSDYSQMRMGRWTVLSKIDAADGKARWLCKCDCGTQREVQIHRILSGRSKSCGCYNLERSAERMKAFQQRSVERRRKARTTFQSLIRTIWVDYRSSAKCRELDFQISEADIEALVFSQCHYCGREPYQKREVREEAFFVTGIDRVNNQMGYVRDNIVSCCKECNFIKKDLTLGKFLSTVGRIFQHNKGHIDELLKACETVCG